jgi:hypothetical protein
MILVGFISYLLFGGLLSFAAGVNTERTDRRSAFAFFRRTGQTVCGRLLNNPTVPFDPRTVGISGAYNEISGRLFVCFLDRVNFAGVLYTFK